MKTTNAIRSLLVLLTCMLMLSQVSVAFSSKSSIAPISDEALPTSMDLELTPPPDEALIVPTPKCESPSPHASLLLIAVASIAISATILIRKARARWMIPVAMLVVATTLLASPLPAHAVDFGNPLDTSNMMLFAYYYDQNGWVLADTVTAFENYTNHGNYYDGWVRVWMDVKDTTFIGTEFYVDVRVRVRSDGWILAWLTRDQSYAYIVFWGRKITTAGPPVTSATVPSRAIHRVFYASKKTFPGYGAIKLYDFTHPTARKLLIFGKSISSGSAANVYFYYTIPAGIQVMDATTSVSYYESSSSYWGKINLDGATVINLDATTYWRSFDWPLSAFTTEVKHTIHLQVSTTTGSIYINFALILWL